MNILELLPYDLLINISSYLTQQDYYRLLQTCNTIHNAITNNTDIWFNLCNNDIKYKHNIIQHKIKTIQQHINNNDNVYKQHIHYQHLVSRDSIHKSTRRCSVSISIYDTNDNNNDISELCSLLNSCLNHNLPTYKIIVTGHVSAGVTSLVDCYRNDNMSCTQSIDTSLRMRLSYANMIKPTQQTIQLQLFDHQQCQLNTVTLTQSIIDDNTGLIYVIDLTDNDALLYAQHTLDLLQKQMNRHKYNKLPVVLVGNKSEVMEQRKISIHDIQQFCYEHNNINYIEISTTKQYNIHYVFNHVILQVHQRQLHKQQHELYNKRIQSEVLYKWLNTYNNKQNNVQQTV